MTDASAPTARLSSVATSLETNGYNLDTHRTTDELFYINPDETLRTINDENPDRYGLKEHAKETAHRHNLHFFHHNHYWCISTLPQEDADEFHYR